VINGHLVVIVTLFMPSLPYYCNCSLIVVHDHLIANLGTNIFFTYHLIVHLISPLFVVIILALNVQVTNSYCIMEAVTTTFTLYKGDFFTFWFVCQFLFLFILYGL